jgi:hypothetical protein
MNLAHISDGQKNQDRNIRCEYNDLVVSNYAKYGVVATHMEIFSPETLLKIFNFTKRLSNLRN